MRLCICVNLTYNQNYPHAAQSFMTSKSLALAVQAAQAPYREPLEGSAAVGITKLSEVDELEVNSSLEVVGVASGSVKWLMMLSISTSLLVVSVGTQDKSECLVLMPYIPSERFPSLGTYDYHAIFGGSAIYLVDDCYILSIFSWEVF
uniref:Uncharacterized protein n=1 Tax=Fusarium oxysporum (strain Fo5176) TaxID=660025 RepID=A0A0D2XHU6_FUSOF